METRAYILLALLIGLVLFHLLVILGVIPKDIIWAGKIKNQKELLRMEVVSFLILGVAITIVTLKLGLLTFVRSPHWIDGGVWGIFIFFTLNTIGNLFAKSKVEKYGFGTLTMILALLALSLILPI